MSLAKELNDANTITENSQPADVENELMTVIGEVLPLLIEGYAIFILISILIFSINYITLIKNKGKLMSMKRLIS